MSRKEKKICRLQIKVLREAIEVQKAFPEAFFVLTGGTALSFFYLHHRFSEDLDFIASGVDDKDLIRISQKFSNGLRKYGRLEAVISDLNFGYFEWWLYSEDCRLRIEIAQKFQRDLFPAEDISGLKLESFAGILLGKFEAFMGRKDPKDTIDLLVAYHQEPRAFLWTLNRAYNLVSSFRYGRFLARLLKAPLEFGDLILWPPYDGWSVSAFEDLRKRLVKDFALTRQSSLPHVLEPPRVVPRPPLWVREALELLGRRERKRGFGTNLSP